MALDWIWSGGSASRSWEVDEANRLLAFFSTQGITTAGEQYTLDGTLIAPLHDLALVAVNAMTAVVSTAPTADRTAYVQALWDATTSSPVGDARYFTGLFDLVALLALSGSMQVI
jgi:oligosaccharide reducing-end xylanase